MVGLYILIGIGCIAIVYLTVGFLLKEFKGVNLPFIRTIYDATFLSKSNRGFWMMDFQGKKICSSCKTVFTEEEWEQFGGIPDRCPKCGSLNDIG